MDYVYTTYKLHIDDEDAKDYLFSVINILLAKIYEASFDTYLSINLLGIEVLR